jgi:hypothetical protein
VPSKSVSREIWVSDESASGLFREDEYNFKWIWISLIWVFPLQGSAECGAFFVPSASGSRLSAPKKELYLPVHGLFIRMIGKVGGHNRYNYFKLWK